MTDRALNLLASLKLEDGRQWGHAATAWQWADARAILDPDHPRKLHWLGRPKGGSKSTDLAGICIAWLLDQAPQLAEGFAVAADEDQANRLLDKARGFIARNPQLQGKVRVEAKRIVGPDGARVRALEADVAGSEGLLTPFIVVDELPNWKATPTARGMWVSIVSAIPKWPGMRLTVIGHAGDPASWQHKVFEGVKTSPAWRVHEVPGPLPWISAAALAEQARLLSESDYRRRHLNQWVASEDRLTNEDDLAACVTLDGSLPPNARDRYVVGVDVGIKRDRTAIVIAHSQPLVEATWNGDGFDDIGQRVVLDRLVVFTGSRLRPVKLDTVEEAIEQAAKHYRAPVVIDPWQAIGLAQRLRDKGIQVREFNFSSASVGRLAATLHLLLRNRALALPDDRELLDELLNVRLRETSPGVLRMDHDAGQHDDRAIALALAAQELLSHPPFDDTPHRFVPRSRGLVAQGSPFDGLGLTPQQERNWEERCRRDFDADRGRGAWDAIHHANNDERSRYRR